MTKYAFTTFTIDTILLSTLFLVSIIIQPIRSFSYIPSKPLCTFSKHYTQLSLSRRNQRYRDDDNYFPDNNNDDYDEYDDNEDYQPRPPRRIRRDPLSNPSENNLNLPSPFGQTTGLRLPPSLSKSILAGVFFLGIGTGVTVDSQINTSPKDLASRDAVDQAAPNPTLCTTYGASAMAFDQRVFVSFNPFNVYVAQADVKPACVLRAANVVSVLQDKGLVNEREVRSCKANMNTWAFVGDLDDLPQLSCVYKSDDAQNEFLSNPKLGIGEDVYDDDRAKLASKKTNKKVKDNLTQGEKAIAAKIAVEEAAKRQTIMGMPNVMGGGSSISSNLDI